MFRISPATMTICILAVLFGLGGAYAFRVYMKEKPVVPPAVDTATVPIASLDLPAGRIITRGDIGLKLRRQMGELPPNTMGSPQDIIGRVLQEPINVGEPFQTTKLFPEGNGPNLSEHLKPGLRAVTVPVDSLGTLGGHVRPGAIVDVLFRATRREDKQGFEEVPEVTVTLFEGVEVLAVGPDPITQRPARTPPVRGAEERRTPMIFVTLACSPEQSAKLRAVTGHGEIAFAMLPQPKPEVPVREVKQTQEVKSPAVTLENVLGVDSQPKQAKTEVYRGGNRTTNVFDVRNKRATLINSVVDAPQIPAKPQPQTPAPAPAPAPGDTVAGPAVPEQN